MFREHEQIVLTGFGIGDSGEELILGDVCCVTHAHGDDGAFMFEFKSTRCEISEVAPVLSSEASSLVPDISAQEVTISRTPPESCFQACR